MTAVRRHNGAGRYGSFGQNRKLGISKLGFRLAPITDLPALTRERKGSTQSSRLRAMLISWSRGSPPEAPCG